VQKFTLEGVHLATWGSPGSGPGQFDSPEGIAVVPGGSVIYVVDWLNHRVQKFAYETVGVNAAEPSVAPRLHGVRPNPCAGDARVALTLASSLEASLEVFDLAGRRLARRELRGLGPGFHEVALSALPPGLQFLRLTQNGRMATSRLAVVR
jgi:DNA-binding beta-propeller fold protein YncE